MLILAANLPRDSFHVRFLLLSGPGALSPEAVAAGSSVHVLGIDHASCSGLGLRCLPSALAAIRRYRALTRDVDIVDAWLIPAMIFAAIAQPLARVPVLMGGRRSLGDVYASKSAYRRRLARLAARRMDVVVANSRAAADEAVNVDGIRADHVLVIPNAVVPASPQPGTRTAIRAAWGFDDDVLVVGCVANYKEGKGLTSLVTAAHQLRQRMPDLRYVLVGEGPLRADLERAIDRHELTRIVVLHGRTADARTLYPAFDMFVQASESEGLPNVVLEAAASGLPIVATSVGGTTEILTANVNAVLVPKNDLERLTAAIAEVADDAALRDRLGRAARARAADYAPARLAASTAALYRRLVGQSGRRDAATLVDRSASIDE